MTCELSIISLPLELIKKSVNGPAVELKTSVNFAFFFKRKLNFGFMPENIFQELICCAWNTDKQSTCGYMLYASFCKI